MSFYTIINLKVSDTKNVNCEKTGDNASTQSSEVSSSKGKSIVDL